MSDRILIGNESFNCHSKVKKSRETEEGALEEVEIETEPLLDENIARIGSHRVHDKV